MYQKMSLIADQKGLSQARIARAINISPTSLSEYFRGRTVPPADVAFRIARELGVTLDFLANDDLEEFQAPASQEMAITTDESFVIRVMRALNMSADHCITAIADFKSRLVEQHLPSVPKPLREGTIVANEAVRRHTERVLKESRREDSLAPPTVKSLPDPSDGEPYVTIDPKGRNFDESFAREMEAVKARKAAQAAEESTGKKDSGGKK